MSGKIHDSEFGHQQHSLMRRAALALLIGVIGLASAQPAYSESNLSALEIRNAPNVVTLAELSEEKAGTIKFWLQQLMLSALYRGVVLESSVSEWVDRLEGDSLIYCRYPATATLAIPEREPLVFDEVVLPMGPPLHLDYIYLKRGQEVVRLAKWDPWVYYKLATESGGRAPEAWALLERHLF